MKPSVCVFKWKGVADVYVRKAKSDAEDERGECNDLIAGVVNTFTLKVEKYNGKITSNLDAVNPDIFVDEMHFTNVIFNLLDNAVKYKNRKANCC